MKEQKWVPAIHRNDYFPTVNFRVCSKHFSESDFKHTNCDVNVSRVKRCTEATLKLGLLKDNAVPSIFPGQPAYMSKNQKVHCKKKCINDSARSTIENTNGQVKYVGIGLVRR